MGNTIYPNIFSLIQRGNLKKDEFLLVTGAGGGMGLSAVQMGKIIGAKVIAAASSQDKLLAAKVSFISVEFINKGNGSRLLY